MKKIAPLFFIGCLILGAGFFIWTARHSSAPVPTLALKHPTVSAQKGPLKLTLTLYSDTVPRGGPLWFRLTVTNVGKKPFNVNDPLFAPYFLDDGKNFIDYLSLNSGMKKGFYLAIFDDKGKWVGSDYMGTGLIIDIDPCLGPYVGNVLWDTLRESWKIKTADQFEKREADEKKFKSLWNQVVNPGQSIETIAWSYHGLCDGQRPHPPTPPGRFAEYYKLDLSKPGTYKVYARLNHVPTKKEIEEEKREDRAALRVDKEMGWKSDWYKSERAKKSDPEDAIIKTPAISFEVLP